MHEMFSQRQMLVLQTKIAVLYHAMSSTEQVDTAVTRKYNAVAVEKVFPDNCQF